MAPATPDRIHSQSFYNCLLGILLDALLAISKIYHSERRPSVFWIVPHRKSISGLHAAGFPCEVALLEHPKPW